ncbi:hypothetical protein QGP82_20930 [Leptothoe sp. LEGE 181152]|nr:hypothetical protein [Leptothoe sp. LEGE 181152]
MSLIHLEKSVITFHFRELLEDGHAGNQLSLLGLGVVLLGPKLLPAIAKASRPVAKQLVKSSYSYRPKITLSEWVNQSRRTSVQQAVEQQALSISQYAQRIK